MNVNLMMTDSGVNPQRILIEELERLIGYSLYSTQDAAAAAVAEELWCRSRDNNVEYCSMVFRIDLSLYGGYGHAYYSEAIVRGMHDNVFLQLIFLDSYADEMVGNPVAFVHSHPHCTCHKSNEFSHGDKGVPAISPVSTVYLIGENHILQRWDKDGSEREELMIQIDITANMVYNWLNQFFGGD